MGAHGGVETAIDRFLRELNLPPYLDGALCTGNPGLFGPRTITEGPARWVERRDAALTICRSCPALSDCKDWAASLPRHALTGIVGGRVLS